MSNFFPSKIFQSLTTKASDTLDGLLNAVDYLATRVGRIAKSKNSGDTKITNSTSNEKDITLTDLRMQLVFDFANSVQASNINLKDEERRMVQNILSNRNMDDNAGNAFKFAGMLSDARELTKGLKGRLTTEEKGSIEKLFIDSFKNSGLYRVFENDDGKNRWKEPSYNNLLRTQISDLGLGRVINADSTSKEATIGELYKQMQKGIEKFKAGS